MAAAGDLEGPKLEDVIERSEAKPPQSIEDLLSKEKPKGSLDDLL